MPDRNSNLMDVRGYPDARAEVEKGAGVPVPEVAISAWTCDGLQSLAFNVSEAENVARMILKAAEDARTGLRTSASIPRGRIVAGD